MPICIECSYPVSHLYTSYSKADDRSLGKGVRLTQCPRCKRFADKYVEHDYVVLFIDLVLIKPQVYRHLLFNRLGTDDHRFDRSIIRLGVLLLLFDVYLTWARIEKSSSLAASPLATAPIILQYLFFLTLNALATLVHHLTVRLLASVLVPRPQSPSLPTDSSTSSNAPESASPSTPSTPVPSSSNNDATPPWPTTSSSSPMKPSGPPSGQDLSPNLQRPPPPIPTLPALAEPNPSGYPPLPPPLPPPLRRASTAPPQIEPLPPPSPASPNAISTALFVSSCAKLFPILLVIWSTDEQDVPDGGCTEIVTTSTMLALKRAADSSTSTSTTSVVLPSITALPTSLPTLSSIVTKSSMPGSSSFLTRLSTFSNTATFTWAFHALLPLLSLSAANTHLVLLNNIEALYILLDCGYLRAVALALAGQTARWGIERLVLRLFGLR
ncbi:hypothetical protein Egran_03429 [Elaphomyces granulatus]|uniref:Protein ARV n=1 Tax=Elaphomyces granulatus TaxID=519963 RepID=A0A232LXB8_9EURO|nr:hypothetical protein Egran_03429 [Elaphomyces granulatus]